MQVSCSSCGAQYEFDASVIPQAGYDAQCTTCHAIFFVSPAVDEPATMAAPSSEQVAVSCSHCGAVYQFAAAEIPADGYDAQCTQCQGVFFVSVASASKVDVPGQSAEPFEPAAVAASGAKTQAPESTPEAQNQPLVPSPFAAPHDLPEVAEDDYASMSQVIARETLKARQQGHAAQAPASPDAVALPVQPQSVFPDAAELPVQPQSVFPDAAESPVQPQPVPPESPPEPPTMAAQGPQPHVASRQAPAATDVEGGAPDPTAAANTVAEGDVAPVSNWSLAAAELNALTVVASDASPLGFPPARQAPESTSAAGPEVTPAPLSPPVHVDTPRPTPAAERASRLDVKEDDDTKIEFVPKRRSLWRGVALSVLGVVAVGAGVGLFQARHLPSRLLDDGAPEADRATQTAPIPAAVTPAKPQEVPSGARMAFERGMRRLLEDTNQGYSAAQQSFQEALKAAPDMVDAHAGMALQALLAGEDFLTQGQAEWSEAKNLEATAAAEKARLAEQPMRTRRGKELERERLRAAEHLAARMASWREQAMLHLRMGENCLRNGAMVLWRGSQLQPQTPLMQATAALWLSSDPTLTVANDGGLAMSAARSQFAEAAQWLVAPGDAAATGAVRLGADPSDPWSRRWLTLAKARILAAKPSTAGQVPAVLEAALSREPHFTRGRWEIAVGLEQNGQVAAAQKAAEQLLSLIPDHQKARFLLDSHKPVAPQSAVTGAPAEPSGKTGRSRGHRIKRSR